MWNLCTWKIFNNLNGKFSDCDTESSYDENFLVPQIFQINKKKKKNFCSDNGKYNEKKN